jgi:hypothetical protein
LALVLAENTMNSGMYSFGILVPSLSAIVRVFPVPVGPTHTYYISEPFLVDKIPEKNAVNLYGLVSFKFLRNNAFILYHIVILFLI